MFWKHLVVGIAPLFLLQRTKNCQSSSTGEVRGRHNCKIYLSVCGFAKRMKWWEREVNPEILYLDSLGSYFSKTLLL